jgi:hypothetical protein
MTLGNAKKINKPPTEVPPPCWSEKLDQVRVLAGIRIAEGGSKYEFPKPNVFGSVSPLVAWVVLWEVSTTGWILEVEF